MIETRANLAVVGAFVLVAVASAVGVFAILSGRHGPTDDYYTIYANVSGLKFGSTVLYEGYPVGQVEKIQPFNDKGRMRFRVDLSIAHGWAIPKDSLARSESSGILAPQTIAIIVGGSPEALPPGSLIRPGESLSLISSVSSAATNFDELTDQGLLPLVENLNLQISKVGVMIDKEMRPMLARANNVVGQFEEHVPSVLQRVDQAAGDFSAVSRRVNTLLSDERLHSIDGILTDTGEAAADLRKSSADLRALLKAGSPNVLLGLQEFRLVMESLSRYSEPFAQNLEGSSRNLEEFSRSIRRNPSLLLRTPHMPDDVEPPLRPREEH
ncbi:MAG TPA: MlaD family protein [Solimonas sp.]|nr:MlaD family protein [Solimonas sp.]